MGGGGLLLRGVAKAACKPQIVSLGSAAVLASASSPSSSSAPASASAARCVPPGQMMHAAAVGSSALKLAVADDWELAGGEEEYSIRDHLVFGTAPSKEEVEEATADLQNALGMCVGEHNDSASPDCLGSPRPSNNNDASSVHFGQALEWIEPHLVSHSPGTVQVRRRNEVAEAFQLLRNDPVVQGVVMSIASDKAVWEAVLKNEKVKEFRKNLTEQDDIKHDSSKATDDSSSSPTKNSDLSSSSNFLDSLLDSLLKNFKNACSRIKDMINSLLSMADEKFNSEKDGVLKSCFMLSLMVLSFVVLKRVSVA